MNSTPDTFLLHNSELGESPVWDAANNQVYWVDILRGILHWYNFSDLTKEALSVGQPIGAVALAGDGRLVAALEDGFYYINILSRSVVPITSTEKEIKNNRFNDGKCDPLGRFWAGTMSKTNEPMAGKLYMLDQNRQVLERISSVGCSNGLAWSPDHTTFYYIDSLSNQLAAYDFDLASGAISNRRILIHFPHEDGIPDGMTIDSQGGLWIAMWSAGNVSRYDPASGELLFRIELPVTQVTSCTFGGPLLSDLFITTANVGLSERQLKDQPLAGNIFLIRNTGFTGLPTSQFLGQAM